MKKNALILICLTITTLSFGQNSGNGLKVIYNYVDNPELYDILVFEGIEYRKIKFVGKELKGKSYHLTVKEIWDGKIVSDSTIVNSKRMEIEAFRKINDTVLNITVISKRIHNNKLRMTFRFQRFMIRRVFDTMDTDEYSLRDIVEESKLEIGFNKKFYLLAYILPYERADGSKSWCEVGSSGKDIENWGKKFGIKHYLLFEIKFE